MLTVSIDSHLLLPVPMCQSQLSRILQGLPEKASCKSFQEPTLYCNTSGTKQVSQIGIRDFVFLKWMDLPGGWDFAHQEIVMKNRIKALHCF